MSKAKKSDKSENSKASQPQKGSKKQVEKLESKVEELTNDLQRLQADFTNYKRRTEEEKSALAEYGKRDAIKALLPAIDNIDRALSHTPEEIAGNEWVEGVGKVKDLLMKDLAALGVKRINAEGEPFDPEYHEAVQMEDGEGDHEIVVEELQAGYTYNDTVLRHAMVKVGRK